MSLDLFKESFQEKGHILEDVYFSSYTFWGVGGKISLLFFPESMETAVAAFQFIRKHQLPYKIIGKGSNLLVSDDDFVGVVLNLTKLKEQLIQTSEHRFTIGAGEMLQPLCRKLAKMGYKGHEFLSGIPGTIGGAIIMNAGTPEGEVKDILIQATVVDTAGEIHKLSNSDLDFGYRTSRLKKEGNYFIVDADFYFEKEEIAGSTLKKIQADRKLRRAKQPWDLPSCGSVFRNPEGNYAGALVEAVGLKGFRIGDAQVSELHANFIVNVGEAKAADVRAVIEHVQATVLREKGIQLETEVEFFNW